MGSFAFKLLNEFSDVSSISEGTVDALGREVVEFFVVGIKHDFFLVGIFERFDSRKRKLLVPLFPGYGICTAPETIQVSS